MRHIDDTFSACLFIVGYRYADYDEGTSDATGRESPSGN